jgi:D-alanine-D-alanine ligase
VSGMSKTSKLRVAVIFGGRSGEHEVSLMSARSILGALDREKYDIVELGITHDGEWKTGENVLQAMLEDSDALLPAALLPDPTRSSLYHIRTTNFEESLDSLGPVDVFFPVLHGTFGEDGTLQGMLEMQEAAYVGAGVLGSSLGMDKGVFQAVMRAHNLPVVETLVATRAEIEKDMDALLRKAENLVAGRPFPLFVKPANLGSSVGVSKCASRADLVEGLLEASQYDRRILIQRAVNAREIEVSVLGNDTPEVSIPGEVVPSREFYSYEAKYVDGQSALLIPAPLAPEQTEKVRDIARRAYLAVDCAGMARVDFLLDKDTGALFLNEINTIPGFTTISMYPKLWEASGLDYPDLLDRLIELALERKTDRSRTVRRYRS